MSSMCLYQGLGQMLTKRLQHHQGCSETPKCAYVIYGQPHTNRQLLKSMLTSHPLIPLHWQPTVTSDIPELKHTSISSSQCLKCEGSFEALLTYLWPEAAVPLAECVLGAAATRQLHALCHAPVSSKFSKPDNSEIFEDLARTVKVVQHKCIVIHPFPFYPLTQISLLFCVR